MDRMHGMVLLAVGLALQGHPLHCQAQAWVDSLVRQQAVVENALVVQAPAWQVRTSVEEVRAIPGASSVVGRRVRVWRIYRESTPHLACLVVGRIDGQYFPLAGFRTPRVVEFNATLGAPPENGMAERVVLLAFLLDDGDAPNGIGAEMQWTLELDTVRTKWEAAAPEWPTDTLITNEETGEILGRTTIFSYAVRRSAARWIARTYSFLFAPGGSRLLSWSMREGATVPLR